MMKLVFRKKNRMEFDASLYDALLGILKKMSVHTKYIWIPMSAVPMTNKLIARFYMKCSLKKEGNTVVLSWRTCLSMPETIGLFGILLFTAAAVIMPSREKTGNATAKAFFWVLLSLFVILICLNYYWQYRKCNKLFREYIAKTIPQNQSFN